MSLLQDDGQQLEAETPQDIKDDLAEGIVSPVTMCGSCVLLLHNLTLKLTVCHYLYM